MHLQKASIADQGSGQVTNLKLSQADVHFYYCRRGMEPFSIILKKYKFGFSVQVIYKITTDKASKVFVGSIKILRSTYDCHLKNVHEESKKITYLSIQLSMIRLW